MPETGIRMRVAALRQYLRDRQHEYCKRFDIPNTQTVSNWIKRGIIPVENTVVIEEYSHIRLIKAIPYQDKQVAPGH